MDNDQRQNFYFNYQFAQAEADGHFLLLSLGTRIFAIDSLGSGAAGSPRILWSQDLSSLGLDSSTARQLPLNFANMPWRLRQQFSQVQNRPNFLRPKGNNYVCFQRLRN